MPSRDWNSPLPEVDGLLRWLLEKVDRSASEDALLHELRRLLEDRQAAQALDSGVHSPAGPIPGAAAEDPFPDEALPPVPAAFPTPSIVIRTEDGG